jgi:hypothetical protein
MQDEVQHAFYERLRAETLIRQQWIDRAQAHLDELTERFLRDLSRLHGDLHDLVRDLTGVRIHLANRALEREMRIRSATERLEREMASRVLAVERRLLERLERAPEARAGGGTTHRTPGEPSGRPASP